MNLISTRIITAQIETLINFYEQVTGLKATRYTPDFAELKTPGATLAIGSIRTLQFFGGDSVAQPAQNCSMIIEFRVDDVQQRFEQLAVSLKSAIVQEPTIMPWGNQSLLLRDPDGNLVNLFTPVTPEAIEKFKGN
ncbi:VOC family protein [Pedobacter alluvionis]|uniref:Catechol 2,3-dioxygenase-like lactoylglutathione lyase family enzyme n=1 Tax=Pedobacter alluvionis TaxID=475253 RepID=A0A497YL86_9SPHI|nr:VOC family protein [Pedobacter alluvionis]RLJ80840.1 catechol 2,3-dioxygenase-like lactoylglutathione lyase family enzyme [Pedobacter alluvionis]TFB32076.1 VOC family protein [Pedobacter alluvionis]